MQQRVGVSKACSIQPCSGDFAELLTFFQKKLLFLITRGRFKILLTFFREMIP